MEGLLLRERSNHLGSKLCRSVSALLAACHLQNCVLLFRALFALLLPLLPLLLLLLPPLPPPPPPLQLLLLQL